MRIVTPLVLLLLFVVELAAWLAIGFGVHQLLGGGALGLAAGAAASAISVLLWGMFASPKAQERLAQQGSGRWPTLLIKMVIFIAAVVLLGMTGSAWAARGMALAVLVVHVGVQLVRPRDR